MKELVMNTSWSCTPKAYIEPWKNRSVNITAFQRSQGDIGQYKVRVGCDVPAYVIPAKAVNTQLMKAVQCKLTVNEGGTAEIFRPYLYDIYG